VEKEPTDSMLLKRLAVTLSETGDDVRALKLYEKAAELDAKQKPAAAQVLQWMEMGRLYFLAKNYEKAAESFAQVVKALDNPEQYGLDDAVRRKLLSTGDITYQLFGESFLEAGRTDEALAAFEKANVMLPSEGVLAYQRARIEAKRKQPAAALEKLPVYFKKHLSNQGTGPYELLATLLQETNQADQVIPRLEALAADDPENMQITYFLAQQYLKANELTKAEPLFRKLLDAPSKRPPVEAYQGLVDVYRRSNQTVPLLALLGDAVNRGGSLALLGEQAKALEADDKTATALIELGKRQKSTNDPDFDYGRSLAVAMLALTQKQWDAAGEFFELAIKDEPKKTPEILLTWGLGLLVGNQANDAVKVFQRGVDDKVLPADNPTFQFYLSGALEMAGQTDTAIKYATEAAELRKDSPRFLARVGWIQYHAKRYADARASYKALLEKFDAKFEPEEVREVMHEARMALSNIEVIEHHMPDAEEWLEQVLDEYPEDVGALNDLGYLWADQGKHLERSLAMIRKAIAAEPKNMAYLDSLGWVLFRLGRYPEAVTQLQAAAAVEKPDAVIFDHLGDALQKSGDPAGAKAAWQKALEGFEKDNDADKAKTVREKMTR